MKSIHDPRYISMINHLKQVRKTKNVSQVELGERLGRDQKFVSKVESFIRRLDLIELCDWLDALNYGIDTFLQDIGRTNRGRGNT